VGPGWEAQFATNHLGHFALVNRIWPLLQTPLQRHLHREEMVALGWIDADGQPLQQFKSPAQGVATQVWAATSPQLDGLGGLYCEDCDVAEVVAPGTDSYTGVRPYAVDPEQAQRLWTLSAELTGVDPFR